MGTCYSHLTLDERIEIYHLLACGLSCRRIAAQIGRSASTVCRELRRNSRPTKQFAGGYRPARAHHLAERRRRWDARFKMQRQPALRRLVRRRLAMGWSPEQIAGRLAPPPELLVQPPIAIQLVPSQYAKVLRSLTHSMCPSG